MAQGAQRVSDAHGTVIGAAASEQRVEMQDPQRGWVGVSHLRNVGDPFVVLMNRFFREGQSIILIAEI
jgi:hypothetical protein